ncbi:MAG TPA: TetR/AcrR family transcriptional regulator [Hyphomicrobiaceae bacterium]|jgi:ubiquinone biosynthesis protein COQ9|nr:TetR/AcrR family transcriptional regulator [Hyphomicrobiaceae bacterium]
MFDPYTRKGRILAAALGCAANKRWADVTLLDIAESANVPISELRDEFTTKTQLIAGLLRAIDEEVLKRAAKRTEGQEKRDRLFDIIMTRFDVLGPHKAALKSIYASGAADVSLAVPYLSSQHWMLEAAGIGTDGPAGTIKVAGLGMAYAWVFRTWLDDDDPGLAKTMAALDRRLRRGERALGSIEHLNAAVSRFAAGLGELGRSVAGKRKKSNPPADPEVGQV